MSVDIITITYAAVVAVGGIIGYVKAGSVISMVMGLSCGGLMGLAAYQTSHNPNNVLLALLVTGSLTCLMGYRFMNSGKFMPAGLVATLSLLMVLRFALRLM